MARLHEVRGSGRRVPQPEPPRKRPAESGYVRAALLALLTLPLFLLVVPAWRIDWDSAIYVATAESLVAGEGLQYLGYDMAKYPPGMALLLGGVIAIFGRDLLVMRLLMVVMAVGAVFLTERMARPLLGQSAALAVAAVFALSHLLWFQATQISSELPFLCVSLLVLVVARDFVRDPRTPRGILLGILVAATALFRTVGLVLGPAIILALLVQPRDDRRRARLIAAGLLGVMVALLATAWATRDVWVTDPFPSTLPEGATYERQLFAADPRNLDVGTIDVAGVVARVTDNARSYGEMVVSCLSGRRLESGILPLALVAAALLLGLAVLLIRDRGPEGWYLVAYGAVYMIWPFRYERFLTAVLPVLYLAMAAPAAILLRRRPRWLGALVIVVVVLVAGANLRMIDTAIESERTRPYDRIAENDAFRDALLWCRSSLPPNAVLLADHGPAAWFISGRRAFSPQRTTSTAAFGSFLEIHGITHVVENRWPKMREFFAPYREARPDEFRPLRQHAGITIWRRDP